MRLAELGKREVAHELLEVLVRREQLGPVAHAADERRGQIEGQCNRSFVPCGGDALEPIVGLTSRADWASSSAICASISSVRAATSRDQFTEPETERRDGDSGVDAAISLGCFVARSLTYK